MWVDTESVSHLHPVVTQEFGVPTDFTQSRQVPPILIHCDVRSVLTGTPVVPSSEDVGCPASSLRDGG